ncbi:FAD/NAD(P)-binding protein [Falsiroseomonas ponticola]|uniref:FAD/NAD(P)-binding protein n=1 Tax=Falsiroseomonas ponticola TaxID=2786951 RepID=UPI001934067F|nr:FAD/NAD(P)-binding protein [Roseomonas ponticola]
MAGPVIAVIGAGFSGTLVTLHLLRRCPPGTRVVLLERNRRFACGQAYATDNANHLLNVPAARMSAFRDRPDDFLQWLRGREGEDAPGPQSFVSRGLYGDYIRHLLNAELGRGGGALALERADVLALDPQDGELRLTLDRGRCLRASMAILAVGNFPPEPPPGLDAASRAAPWYRADPWAADALAGLDPDAPVLLVGTGLTTVDLVVSLLDAGHRGPIHALSRRGLLPRIHVPGAPASPPSTSLPTDLLALLRLVRREAARRAQEGLPWQPLVDSLRPFTQDLWQTLPAAEKARFLRHLRPWWDVHRHRMAGPVAARIAAARASGQLSIHAGRIRATEEAADGSVTLAFRRRSDGATQALAAARVINCAGPGCDYDRISDPLVRHLLATGLGRPDPFRLGLDVTPANALRGRDGAMSRQVFAVGPVTKGAFWEMTAVPDIRRQCETLAEHLAGLIGALPVAIPAPA